jgi:hypothetical protein
MNKEKIAELEAVTAAAKAKAEEAGGQDESLNNALKEAEKALADAKAQTQDPLKAELDRIKSGGKTEKEKAEFSLKKNAERLKELGGDPYSALGVKTKEEENEDGDDALVTIGMLKRMKQEDTEKTSVQLAESIQDETERELVKYHLKNTIRSTGNPQEDLSLARSIVNAKKNAQILELGANKGKAKDHPSGYSAPSKIGSDDPEEKFTPEELAFMKPPFNMKKEDILKARKIS